MHDHGAQTQGSDDPLIAEEARRWQAQHRRERAIGEEARWQTQAAWLAGFVLYLGGPIVALPLSVVLTGGPELAILITVATCGMAGLLWAVWARNVPGVASGAIAVLIVSLLPGAMLAATAWIIAAGFEVFTQGGGTEAALVLALFVLIMVASAEAGYLASRPLASRKRNRAAATLDGSTIEITLDILEEDGRRHPARFYGRKLAANDSGDVAYLSEDGRLLYHFDDGELLALTDQDLGSVPDWMDSTMYLDIMDALGGEAVIDTGRVQADEPDDAADHALRAFDFLSALSGCLPHLLAGLAFGLGLALIAAA